MAEERNIKFCLRCGAPAQHPSNYCSEHRYDDSYCEVCHESPHQPDCTIDQYGQRIAALEAMVKDLSKRLDAARYAMVRAMDALESDADLAACRAAFELLQDQFEGVEMDYRTVLDQVPKELGGRKG